MTAAALAATLPLTFGAASPVRAAPPVGSPTSTAVAPGALIVSPSGSDSAAGTLGAPLRTLGAAISRAQGGQSILVRGGTYRESLTIPDGKPLYIGAFPSEEVWLDGSREVTGFARSGPGYAVGGWTREFDSSPTHVRGAADGAKAGWAFVNPRHPLAAHPDQVWIGGAAQRQVGSLRQLAPGAFFVDYAADRLYVGTDPKGKTAHASDRVRALAVRASGTVIDGINVRRFSPSVPDMGAVTIERPQVALRNMSVVDNATTGVHVGSAGVTLTSVTLARNGMLGANAAYADRLVVRNVRAIGNNTERFNSSPVSGGLKITRSRGVVVQDSEFLGNHGPGLWVDESVYDSRIVGNDLSRNAGHGLSLELSSKARVIDNTVIGNRGHGIKVNGTSDVQLWNNTVSGPGRAINIVQDARRASNRATPGHDPRRPFPDPTMTWINRNIRISNSLLSSTGVAGTCVLCVEDYSREFSAERMHITALGNVYHRASVASPKWTVVWSNGARNPSVYTTLASFASAERQESPSHAILGAIPLDRAGEPTSAVVGQTTRVAQALPASLARQAGVVRGTRHLGAFPR